MTKLNHVVVVEMGAELARLTAVELRNYPACTMSRGHSVDHERISLMCVAFIKLFKICQLPANAL